MRPPALPCLVAILLLAASSSRAAEAGAERSTGELLSPAAERAIQRGLAFLAGRQHDDGTIGAGAFSKNVAVVSFCGMAMMAAGSTPGRGPYGAEVTRCLDFVLASTRDNGYVLSPGDPGGAEERPMYGHGFATMFLAECYGMSPRPHSAASSAARSN